MSVNIINLIIGEVFVHSLGVTVAKGLRGFVLTLFSIAIRITYLREGVHNLVEMVGAHRPSWEYIIKHQLFYTSLIYFDIRFGKYRGLKSFP